MDMLSPPWRRPGRRAARGAAVGIAGALLLVACGGSDTADVADNAGPAGTAATVVEPEGVEESTDDATATDDAAAPTPVPFTVPQIDSTPSDVTLSGLAALRSGLPDGAPEPLVPLDEIRSGGPPPDGIPPIDAPTFLAPADVTFLGETELVLALDVDGDARAYPIQILMWHEIVNDTVGGVPVTVTYCPLCNSALAYDRRIEDRIVDFGTSGSLWNSALIMYDRQTETLWSHFTGAGIVGELTGVVLDTFPVQTVPWGAWRDAHPDGLVLSRETGFSREYGFNPYPGYDGEQSRPFLFEGEVDGRYTAMTRIVGIELGDAALGVPLFVLQRDRVVHADLDGSDVVVFWAPGAASALDAMTVAGGGDIGATGVFLATLDGDSVRFEASGDGFVDAATGSTWSLFGEAVDGPLAGRRLERIRHVDTFWFAWGAFRPDSGLVDDGGS